MLTAFSGMLTLSLRFLHLLKVCLTDSFDWDINNLKYRKAESYPATKQHVVKFSTVYYIQIYIYNHICTLIEKV